MSSIIPVNQKHLTLDNRVFIEKCLDQDMAMKDIAKPLCKDPSTISKEVKKHRTFHPHNDLAIKALPTDASRKRTALLKRSVLPLSSVPTDVHPVRRSTAIRYAKILSLIPVPGSFGLLLSATGIPLNPDAVKTSIITGQLPLTVTTGPSWSNQGKALTLPRLTSRYLM